MSLFSLKSKKKVFDKQKYTITTIRQNNSSDLLTYFLEDSDFTLKFLSSKAKFRPKHFPKGALLQKIHICVSLMDSFIWIFKKTATA